ncbi:MAG TPA: hypothetical protein VI160_00240 [Gemmatimonadales bacterium]
MIAHPQALRRLALAAGLVSAFSLAARTASAQAPAAPTVTVSGVAYTQYAYQLKDTANHVNNFSVQRAYVNVLGKFAGGIATRVTLDVTPAAAGNQFIRLKYAYFAYTPDGSALTYKLGLIHTPWLDWEEALWDYRMQGSMALDRNGYLTSSDAGVGVDGKWNSDQVNAQLAIVNGEGYSGGTGDQRKDVEGRVSVRVMNTDDASRVGGLRLSGYFGIGRTTAGGIRDRYIAMASYKSAQVTLAGEIASTRDAAGNGNVISAFGVYHFTGSKAAVIGRLDVVKPDKAAPSTTPGYTNTRLIIGPSYQLSPNVRLLADVDLLSFKNESSLTPAQQLALDATRQTALFQAQFTF